MSKTAKAIRAMAMCLAALLPCVSLAAQGAPLVAIMEPYGNAQVTAITKATVMGALRDGLLDDGRYEAVTRDTLDRVMKEHAFQRSDFADSGSAKRIGKMLGADLICVADVIREGREINVAVQMIDVETGRIAHSGSKTFAAESNAFVHEITQEIVEKMMRRGGARGDVYAVNDSGGKLRYWKNGQEVRAFRYDGFNIWNTCQSGGEEYYNPDARSIVVSGGSVYSGGYEWEEHYAATVWRGGSVIDRLSTGAAVWGNGDVLYRLSVGAQNAVALAICVNGTDVYAGGWEDNQQGNFATVWKNGSVLWHLTSEASRGTVRSLAVSSTDVYAGGWEDNQQGHFATIWKNGRVLYRLNPDGNRRGNTGASVSSIFVAGADVYAAGQEDLVATVWKNGNVLYRLNNLGAGAEEGDDGHLVFVR